MGNLNKCLVAVNIGRRKNAKTRMPQVGKANTGFKKAFGSWAKKTGLEYNKVWWFMALPKLFKYMDNKVW